MFFAAILLLVPADPPPAPAGKIAFMRAGFVWIINADGSNERQLTRDKQYDRPLAWSPDGGKRLFWNHADPEWNIWVMDADGKKRSSFGDRGPTEAPGGRPRMTNLIFVPGATRSSSCRSCGPAFRNT